MRMRYIVAFKENGEIIKTGAMCNDKTGELTKKEKKRIGEYREAYYFDSLDELINYVLMRPQKFGIRGC